MTWFTYIIGLVVFAIGAACKFWLKMAEWQALLPMVIGLGYLTLAEGMRAQKKAKRTFVFLAILWSFVVFITMIPVARQAYAVWFNDPNRQVDAPLRPELLLQQASVLVICVMYCLVALYSLFRKPPATPVSPAPNPTSGR